MASKKRKIVPLPFPVYFWTIALLSLVGILDALYLAINHYRNYLDIGYTSFCAISRAINCDTVAQSTYSIFAGIPVAVWGLIGYVFFLSCLAFAWDRSARKERVWVLLIILSSVFSSISMVYALISIFQIRSYCIMCVLSYAVNFMLFYFTWITRRRFSKGGIWSGLKQDIRFFRYRLRRVAAVMIPLSICVLLLWFFFPAYWHLGMPVDSPALKKGITKEGHPWIGAEKPELEIIEFSDYLCFQCKKNHYYLRRLVAEFPDKIKLVHRHFPMDSRFNPIVTIPFHEGAGKMALLANYAQKENRFWQMNDILFSQSGDKDIIDLADLAAKTGFDQRRLSKAVYDRQLILKLLRDIGDGINLGITGTPAYVINGKVFIGQIPPEIIETVID